MSLVTIYFISLLGLGAYLGWNILFHQGHQYIQAGKYKKAVRLYNWLIPLAPRHSMARNNRGYARYCLRDIENAVKDYERAIELNSQNYRAFSNLITLYVDIGEINKALSVCGNNVDRNPQYAPGYYCRGYVHAAMELFNNAIEDFSQAIELLEENSLKIKNPRKRHRTQLSKCFFLRGECFYRVGNVNMAMEDMNQAFELNSLNKYAVYNRGFFQYHMGNLEAALTDYDRAIELDDQFAYPYAGRGKCYFEQGDLQAALENFIRANELESTELYALAGLAVTQHALGEIQIAQAHWHDLLERDEQHRQPDWLAEEYGWNPPLARQAEQLMADL